MFRKCLILGILMRKKMNDLQKEIDYITDVVVASCLTIMSCKGEPIVTREEILSKSKKRPVVKARNILCFALHRYHFETLTICNWLHCTPSAVSKMVAKHAEYKKIDRAYLLACKSIKMTIENTDDV